MINFNTSNNPRGIAESPSFDPLDPEALRHYIFNDSSAPHLMGHSFNDITNTRQLSENTAIQNVTYPLFNNAPADRFNAGIVPIPSPASTTVRNKRKLPEYGVVSTEPKRARPEKGYEEILNIEDLQQLRQYFNLIPVVNDQNIAEQNIARPFFSEGSSLENISPHSLDPNFYFARNEGMATQNSTRHSISFITNPQQSSNTTVGM